MSRQSWIILSTVLGCILLNVSQSYSYPVLFEPSTSQISQRSILDSLMTMFRARQPRREGIRRSGELCPISPGLVESDRIWSNQPLFLWQGTVNQILLKEFESGKVLWNQDVEPTVQQIRYDGEALEPGLYQWEVFDATGTGKSYVFELIGGDQREQITDGLQQLETTGDTAEDMALAQAEFFAQQGLWSDAFQVLYSIDQPSPTVRQAAQEITAYICPTGNSEQ